MIHYICDGCGAQLKECSDQSWSVYVQREVEVSKVQVEIMVRHGPQHTSLCKRCVQQAIKEGFLE